MKKRWWVAALIASSLAPPAAAQIDRKILENAEWRNVLITARFKKGPGLNKAKPVPGQSGIRKQKTGDTFGSGVTINGRYVLTADHVIEGRNDIQVGDAQAWVIKADPKRDLALLYVAFEHADFSPVAFMNPVNDQALFAVSNPDGIVGKVTYGYVIQITKAKFMFSDPECPECLLGLTDLLILLGSSGGGYWDAATGRLVGIVEGFCGDDRINSVLISAQEIVDFLKDTPASITVVDPSRDK